MIYPKYKILPGVEHIGLYQDRILFLLNSIFEHLAHLVVFGHPYCILSSKGFYKLIHLLKGVTPFLLPFFHNILYLFHSTNLMGVFLDHPHSNFQYYYLNQSIAQSFYESSKHILNLAKFLEHHSNYIYYLLSS